MMPAQAGLPGTRTRVVFRADASLSIGTGHVMRCLTLADALRDTGAECVFLCREHPGNLIAFIRSRGHTALPLPMQETHRDGADTVGESRLAHAAWLGADWHTDLAQCRAAVGQVRADWLVIDHYALDARWEQGMRAHCRRLMVIDDLADRRHDCDLLLDQNLGRCPADYSAWTAASARVLAGPSYALLRPEFAALRARSLQRPRDGVLRRILIAMGGIDEFDATGKVLQALRGCGLPPDCGIWVVMGAKAPWLERVRAQAHEMPRPTEVLVGISDMGSRMADSDLAIGAAGGTSWERCCLGLPAILVVLADNQRAGAQALHDAAAAVNIGGIDGIVDRLPIALDALCQADGLAAMSRAASGVADGLGVTRVLQAMERIDE